MATELYFLTAQPSNVVLRLDGTILEVLMSGQSRSMRVHVNMATIELLPSRHGDQVCVRLSAWGHPEQPVATAATGWDGVYTFSVPVAQQPALEQFVAEVQAARVPGTPFTKVL